MIIVNFKMALGSQGAEWMQKLAGFLDGKASATFVTLSGTGIALMSNSAIRTMDAAKLRRVRGVVLKRALFLLVIGLLFYLIWPADILHYYAIYLPISLTLLKASNGVLLLLAGGIIIAYPLLLSFVGYETSWNFDALTYADFWTFQGFLRNLLVNGFHPVVPWVSFMMLGLWFGRLDLGDEKRLIRILTISVALFVFASTFSWSGRAVISFLNLATAEPIALALGQGPMPPLPLYMITGSCAALITISSCILIGNRFSKSFVIRALHRTGQMALSLYLAHVFIGIGLVEEWDRSRMGRYPIEFTLPYALLFGLGCVGVASWWHGVTGIGPIEWLLKRFSRTSPGPSESLPPTG
jgi:uncharacterized membrane protein YeiB